MWIYNLVFALFYTSTLGHPGIDGPSPRSPPPPFFEQTSSSVMVQPGQTVQVPCRVRHLGDKIVSWIRRRDLHIIASAGFMFTADARFSVLHPEGDSSAWTLQLRAAQPQDQGLYECQVNTEPKMKQAVLLTVTDSVPVDDALELSMGDDASALTGGVTRIQGPREQYVRSGSTWTLTCEVSGLSGIRPPLHQKTDNFLAKPQRLVDWLHEGKLLTYQSSRGGISVDTEHGDGVTISRLTLANLRNEDTGRYVCKPMSTSPAVVTIIVIEGEKTAMLGRSSASLPVNHWVVMIVLVLLTVRH